MKFINELTKECVNISGLKRGEVENTFVSAEAGGREQGARFCNKWSTFVVEQRDSEGKQFFTLAENVSVAPKAPRGKKQKEPQVAEPGTEQTIEQPQVETPAAEQGNEPIEGTAPATEPAPEVTIEPAAEPTLEESIAAANEPLSTSEEIRLSAMEISCGFVKPQQIAAELARKYGEQGRDIFNAVMDIVQQALHGFEPAQPATQPSTVSESQVCEICEQYFANKRAECMKIEVKTPAEVTHTIEGVTNKDFSKFVNLVSAGKPLYMYGPAGSGKSYTAKQIAEGLGLDYYETSQAMFAHELKGYGDAKGEFVETAFYRAFAKGGLFFLDEVDASAPEALVVLNNAIANKRFDFPVIGNVDAHENFRVVAAGNTKMTGATLEYTARQMQDTSFKNRFFFAVVGYDRRIFLNITGGDEEIVNFGEDLRRAARETGISQLFSYRQAKDLATLLPCCEGDEEYLFRGSVLQEKEADDAMNLYEHLQNKSNRWAKVMFNAIAQIRNEEVW